MNQEDFMNKMLRPTYVWRMAMARGNPWARRTYDWAPDKRRRGYYKAAETQSVNAQKEIDDLVLARARTIIEERGTWGEHQNEGAQEAPDQDGRQGTGHTRYNATTL